MNPWGWICLLILSVGLNLLLGYSANYWCGLARHYKAMYLNTMKLAAIPPRYDPEHYDGA